MAIYLRRGAPDQVGWLNPGPQRADGRIEYLIKPGTELTDAQLDVLNDLICAESDSSSQSGSPIAGMG